jgi:hypothetical protein
MCQPKNLPSCPTKHNCVWGTLYPDLDRNCCQGRKRTEEGLFECLDFEERERVKLADICPTIELFPNHDFGKK